MTITTKDLEGLVNRLNIETNNITKPYTKDDQGKFTANIGNYHLDMAYGGYALYQMTNKNGGVNDIFGGHMPKRELYNRIRALLTGINIGQTEA